MLTDVRPPPGQAHDVIQAFLARRPSENASRGILRTDGWSLWARGWHMAWWSPNRRDPAWVSVMPDGEGAELWARKARRLLLIECFSKGVATRLISPYVLAYGVSL